MGIMIHNAIIATTWNSSCMNGVKEWIAKLEDRERGLFLSGCGWVNNEQTIVMIPDGSKEGWEESVKGDALRKAFLERLEQDTYEDGSSPWRWIEVYYGEFGQGIVRGNNTGSP